MGYGDVLVHTTGPSYGQNIVRNVGVSSGGGGGGAPDAHKISHQDGGADELDLTGLSGGFQNPYPDPVTFEDDATFENNVEIINPYATPAAPTAVESAVAGVVTVGNHNVRLLYHTAAGSVLSSATVVASDGSHKIDVTVPAKPVGVLTIDVVMSKSGDGMPYLVDDDVAVGAYAINTDDAGLTVEVQTGNSAGGNLTVAGQVRVGSGGLALSDSIQGYLEVLGVPGIGGGFGQGSFGLFNLNGNAYIQLDNDDNIYLGVNLVVDSGVQLGGTLQLGVAAAASVGTPSTHKLRVKDSGGVEYDVLAVAV